MSADAAQPTYHVSVLLNESVEGLNVRPDGIYVDATFGGGGHSRAILERLGENGRLFAFDQDADALANVPQGESRLEFVQSNFRFLRNWMRYYEVDAVDGILADLGVSAHHFDTPERGFSFRADGPLDMRMNARAGRTAADVVATYDEDTLADLFYLYGELHNSRRLAAAVVKARSQKPIVRIGDLLDAVSPCIPAAREKKELAKVFQALRIEVNGELNALRDLLNAAAALLRESQRLTIPLARRPHGEKLCARRQRGRPPRDRLLRPLRLAPSPRERPRHRAFRRRTGPKSAQPQCKITHCRAYRRHKSAKKLEKNVEETR